MQPPRLAHHHTTITAAAGILTNSELAQEGTVECVAPPPRSADHGALLVDPAHPHHFIR